MEKKQQKVLELKANLYEIIKGQYTALDHLVKRLQDDDKGIVPFKQDEGERLALAFALDYFDDMESQIQTQTIQIEQMSDARKNELLRNFVGWFIDHQTSDRGLCPHVKNHPLGGWRFIEYQTIV